jgi:hypothetical protein
MANLCTIPGLRSGRKRLPCSPYDFNRTHVPEITEFAHEYVKDTSYY